jgi:hypothetical protein
MIVKPYFAYHSHPDIFHKVLADQPALIKFLSNSLVGAVVGAIASKWIAHKSTHSGNQRFVCHSN